MTQTIPEIVFVVLKILILISLSLYAIFSAVIIRQEQLMAHVLEESFEPILRILVLIHFFAALGVLFLAFVLL